VGLDGVGWEVGELLDQLVVKIFVAQWTPLGWAAVEPAYQAEQHHWQRRSD